MTKKRRKKPMTKSNKLFYTNLIVALILLLSFIMIVLKEAMGIIGTYVAQFFFILFGLTAYIAPFLILYFYFAIRKKGTRLENRAKHISIFLLSVNALLILAIIFKNGLIFSERIENSITLAKNYTGSGVIAVALHFIFELLIGDIGIYILTTFNLFFTYLTFTKTSLKTLIHNFGFRFKQAKVNREKKRLKQREETFLPIKEDSFEVKKQANKIFDKRDSNQEPSINYYQADIDHQNKIQDSLVIEKSDGQIAMSNDYDQDYIYEKPPLALLSKPAKRFKTDSEDVLVKNGQIIVDTLHSFGIDVDVVNINNGPTVTSYELKPEAGIKVSRILNLSNDLSLALASSGIRIEAPIPGKPYVGIEVPNVNKDVVSLSDLLSFDEFSIQDNDLTVALGKNLFGKPIFAKINEMPHILIAGATGAGKSVCINSIIMSLIFKYSPEDVEFIMIDPKRVELSVYNGIPHLKGRKVVYDAKRATNSLDYAVREMVDRYEAFAKNKVRDMASYNELLVKRNEKKMPYLVVIIDELSDLMMESSKEVENHITRIAQMGRAAGIHLIIATQRPSVDVITGVIKANVPSRISFQVSSQIDSRTILDMSGAEKLLGKGDMLYYPAKFPKPMRVQGTFVTDQEVERVVTYIKRQNEEIEEDVAFEAAIEVSESNSTLDDKDELLDEAIDFVIREQQGSISAIQRRFSVGYNRAGRMIDQMEKLGIVGPHEGSKPRKILKDMSYLEESEEMQEWKENENIKDEFS